MANFGSELPDQVDLLDNRTEAQIVLLSDVQGLIRERATLELQYGKALQAVAKKTEKLIKQHMFAATFGDNPSKAVNEEMLVRSTLFKALSFLSESFDRTAQEHLGFSEVLNIQVADDIKALEKKKEETRKKHAAFYKEIVSDRDQVYTSRTKAQQKYYDACGDFESSRQKQDKVADDKHADRAAKQFEEINTTMLDAKNTFLTAISVSNRAKEHFYSSCVPAIENQFQLLQTSVTSRLTYILQNYCAFNSSHLSTLSQTVGDFQKTLTGVNHEKDDEVFIDANRRPFTIPSDWGFEPCPAFYDTPHISVEPEPKVYLQNKLARSQNKLSEVKVIHTSKENEAAKLRDLASRYADDPKLGSADTTLDSAFDAFHAAAKLGLTEVMHTEEVRFITEAVGGDRGGQSPHAFKSSSFAVPTTCGYCKTSIWGLSKQGKTCKACGLNVHAKCELKCPAECRGTPQGGPVTVERAPSAPNVKGSKRVSVTLAGSAGALNGNGSRSSLDSSASGTSTPHSFAKSPGSHLINVSTSSTDSSGLLAKSRRAPPPVPGARKTEEFDAAAAFDFTASSTYELTVVAGTPLRIVEEDEDGSGWLKVSDGKKKGLVPSSYIQRTVPASNLAASKGKKVRGLYPYDAQGSDEISIGEGEVITLTPGGENFGEGWYEGMDRSGKTGIFPSNYVEMI